MSLYAIGDLHLHFQSELKAEAQLNDPVWIGHEERLMENCKELISDEDTLVLVGDHSWGRNLAECEADFEYIRHLPGRKILTRGNHDMFWDAKKTRKLNDRFQPELTFLQDGFEIYEDYALVATKGYAFEGPYYVDKKGQIIGYDDSKKEHADKLVRREAERLRKSLDAAMSAGYTKIILFLHYPPTNVMEKESIFTDLAAAYRVEQVIYAHCHGQHRFKDSIQGNYKGRLYRLVSGDYLNWEPLKILD